MNRILQSILLLPLLSPCISFASNHYIAEVGAFESKVGTAQFINKVGLIGDHFSIDSSHHRSLYAGFLYLRDMKHIQRVQLKLGAGIFHLANVKVEGKILQELFAENLSYQYRVNNTPVLFLSRFSYESEQHKRVTYSVDVGAGVNIIQTSDYQDMSIDGGVTQPEDAFSGRHSVKPSGMAGLSLQYKLKNSEHSLQLGYRFFYLDKSELPHRAGFLDELQTGTSFAHVLYVGLSL